MTILVIGRLQAQIEEEIWEKKIKPFLVPGTYETSSVGGALKKVVHKDTGNRILFFSHHDAVNARDKVQAFTAPVVWLDEMPTDSGIISELIMRTLTLGGRFYGTFTPLIENEEIYKIVEEGSTKARKFNLNLLQNPVFAGREEEIEGEIRSICATDAEFRARMYGEWYRASDRVIRVPNRALAELPPSYHPGWRHFATIDPAASGLVGLLVMAEDPENGSWYTQKAKYLQGTSAFQLVKDAEKELEGLYVCWRLCDNNPAGFRHEAVRQGIPWVPVEDKSNRKVPSIEATNENLALGKIFLTSSAELLKSECAKCKWVEGEDKIRKATRFHLIDCLRYFVEYIPAFVKGQSKPLTETQALRRIHHRKHYGAEAPKSFKVIGKRSRLWNINLR